MQETQNVLLLTRSDHRMFNTRLARRVYATSEPPRQHPGREISELGRLGRAFFPPPQHSQYWMPSMFCTTSLHYVPTQHGAKQGKLMLGLDAQQPQNLRGMYVATIQLDGRYLTHSHAYQPNISPSQELQHFIAGISD